MILDETDAHLDRTLGARVAVMSMFHHIQALLRKALHEPLVHFFAIGAVIVLLGGVGNGTGEDPMRIVVTPDRVAKIVTDYEIQFGAPPSRDQLALLVDNYIDDEVLFRQGQGLGLEKGDEIVRRRVVQKMQFLSQNLTAPPEPTDAQLGAFYRAHAAQYTTPERVTFTHIYFSPDRGGDAAAKARATSVLATLNNSVIRAPDRGDAFADLYDYSSYAMAQVQNLFGHTPFAQAIFTLPTGQWSGPFRSGYGWHLVRVSAHDKAALPPLAKIRDTVRADYLQTAQDQANKQTFAALKARYTVVREDGTAKP